MHQIDANLGPFREYMRTRREFLKSVDCPTSCRDPLSEFSEWLVAKLLSATLAESRVQKGFDLIRPNGRQVQVKYLANPSAAWINEHHVKFTDGVDEYAIVFFEEFSLRAVILFRSEEIGAVCAQLGKRHPRQDRQLQLTKRNFMTIIDQRESFESLGVDVFLPSDSHL